MHAEGTKHARESAAVSDRTKISCVDSTKGRRAQDTKIECVRNILDLQYLGNFRNSYLRPVGIFSSNFQDKLVLDSAFQRTYFQTHRKNFNNRLKSLANPSSHSVGLPDSPGQSCQLRPNLSARFLSFQVDLETHLQPQCNSVTLCRGVFRIGFRDSGNPSKKTKKKKKQSRGGARRGRLPPGY